MASEGELKLHKIEVRQKEGSSGLMVGANTEVLIDGKPLKGVMGVKFEVDAKGLAKLDLTMFAKVVVSGNFKKDGEENDSENS